MHQCNAGVQYTRTHAVCTVDRLQKCYGPAAFELRYVFLRVFGFRLSACRFLQPQTPHWEEDLSAPGMQLDLAAYCESLMMIAGLSSDHPAICQVTALS